jgi:hypothetical protein
MPVVWNLFLKLTSTSVDYQKFVELTVYKPATKQTWIYQVNSFKAIGKFRPRFIKSAYSVQFYDRLVGRLVQLISVYN